MATIRTMKLALLAVAIPLTASAEETSFSAPSVRIETAFGYSFIKGQEIVYDQSGDRVSHLFWESRAPMLSTTLDVDLGSGWSIGAGGSLAGFGASHMEDYDWLQPYFVSYDFDDWTHRSVHPATRLHHYFTGDLALRKRFALGPATSLNLHGGVSYTDVSWTAYGGSYTYSDTGFRNDPGNFGPGVAGISFQQRYPGVFLGAGIAASKGRFSVEGRVRGGLSIGASDTDFHWARDLRFEESYGTIPFMEAQARVNYDVTDQASFFLSGGFQQYFHAMGTSTIYDIPTGTQISPTTPNAAGMSLRTLSISVGLNIRL